MKNIQQVSAEIVKLSAPSSRPLIPPLQDASTRCPVCGGDGYRSLRKDEPGWLPTGASVPCEACAGQRAARSRQALQNESSLTSLERTYRLSDILTENRPGTALCTAACRDMLEGRAFFITLWGSHGNGKSMTLIAALNEFLDHGYAGLYLPAYDLLNWLQDAISFRNESTVERLKRVKQVDFLALDELQAARLTDWRLEQIRSLIDHRWRQGLEGNCWTLLAMNEDPSRLEARIFSRLRDGRNRVGGPPILHNADNDIRPLLQR